MRTTLKFPYFLTGKAEIYSSMIAFKNNSEKGRDENYCYNIM